ncbi:pantoate--beta-alanine ligase [Verrucomicrobium sp. BvORR034]|uniref:pantoate--beta-alanine ligase n=1 Tax=Verrucomicrobium sp. BvORR034 TaxID=1396418 RepID=UPI00067954EC|nr:pantoate--beta-alanine ligase [Verrucomicrobium sp. BvORR034]
MTLLPTLAELNTWRAAQSGPVVFVPTMGALHEGHLQLMRDARQIAGEGGKVIVSIFVNPLQFGPKEDFAKYPRELEADAAKCASVGVDAIFAPEAADMYPPDRSVMVLETKLSTGLCGASRPGHFDGVGTVVLKLFNLVQPHTAVFGKKDYQQLAIIRRVVRDLNVPVQIVGSETVREEDGLAMSSRNRYLAPEQRAQAPAIRRSLLHVRRRWLAGERNAAVLIQAYQTELQTHASLGVVDYIACVDRDTLEPLTEVDSNALLATAVFFDRTRLIDNLELDGTL